METVAVEQFRIDALAPGTHRGWLHALDLLAGPARLPLLAAVGARPGPALLAVAGVHGDEYEGMEALRAVFAALDPERMAGRFVAIPVANPFAYEARARVAPLHLDGANLARVFPGDPAGTPSRLLAHRLLDLVLRNVGPDDLFLDFHSGSADVAYAPLIGFRDLPGAATARAEAIARHAGLPRLWRIPDAPGPFNAETARRGIVTLGTETTGRGGCDPTDVALFVEMLWNLLAHLGICPDRPTPQPLAGPARATVDVLAPATGFLRPDVRLHDEVSAGQRLGTLVDLFGDLASTVRAPIGGTVWAARATPPVRVGELCFVVAG